jgi:antitoxin component YwqK of YwqJK toxin-antitoxin module
MNAGKKSIIYVLITAFALALVGGSVLLIWHVAGVRKPAYRLHTAAMALRHIYAGRTTAVGEEILALNPLRKEAGLTEVTKDWRIVACGLVVMDGPTITVLLNEEKVPSKVILTESWRPLSYVRIREYEVSDGRLSGRAATWLGEAHKLFTIESYRDNKLNGPTTYYSESGDEICRCDFRDGRPWTGRKLDRDNFNSISMDTSYKEGNKHGEDIVYGQAGEHRSLNTYKEGVPYGPQRQYHQGELRSERIVENGVTHSFKSWHQNGQLHQVTNYLPNGRPDGVRQIWNEEGELEVEEHYRDGKEHGRRWWKGQDEAWFWKGKHIGSGNMGKTEFQRREQK